MAVPADDLANVQLFKALPRPQLEEIAKLVRVEERSRDEVVLKEGAPHDALYVVKEGKVGVFMAHPKYKVTMMAEELINGDAFGLVSLATGGTVESTFSTLTRTALYRLDRNDFTSAAKRSPGLIAGVARALAMRMARERGRQAVPFVSLGGKQLDRRLWALAPENMLIANRMVPVDLSGKAMTVAMVDPEDVGALNDLSGVLAGFNFKLVAVGAPDMERYIAAGFGKKKHRAAVVSAAERPPIVFLDDDSSLSDSKGTGIAGHIVQLATEIVGTALVLGASDIHIETEAKGGVVRYRVDGQLRQRPDSIGLENMRPLVSRFKLLSKMDITETRRPRDGRISLTAGKRVVDLRVSTVPAKFGEKVVIRLLDSASNISNLRNIITVDPVREVFSEMLSRPHGLILVTGPTGSGKTTTLYTALAEKRRPEINMVTVEDPIEYHLDGATQVQANAEIGITFEVLLRGILRQDPDVIMIGETRDRETARIAVEASMTGHLVLTSVHTNSAVDAIMRLVDLGAERYSIATGLMAVVHQRLVRRLCASCKEPFEYPQPIVERLHRAGVLQAAGSTVLLRGVGCELCHGTGFRGRIGVYELLNVNDQVKLAIATGAEPARLKEVALSTNALFDISRYARVLLARGETTPTEILHLAEQGVSSHEAFSTEERVSSVPAVTAAGSFPATGGSPGVNMPWLPSQDGNGEPEPVRISVLPNTTPASSAPRVSAAPASNASSPPSTRVSTVPERAETSKSLAPSPQVSAASAPRVSAAPAPKLSAAPASAGSAAPAPNKVSRMPSSDELPAMSAPEPGPRSPLGATLPPPATDKTKPSRKAEGSSPPVLELDLFETDD